MKGLLHIAAFVIMFVGIIFLYSVNAEIALAAATFSVLCSAIVMMVSR